MARPVTLFTGQWADLPFEKMCELAASMGYEGLEIACWGDHMDVARAAKDDAYVAEKLNILKKYNLKCWALGHHLGGQCVADLYDARLDNFAPAECKGDPEKIRNWGIDQMKCAAVAAKKMGCYVVTGFMGSPIWKFWYSFPQTTEQMIEDGFKQVIELWTPILDVFEQNGIKFALEIHPTEIAFDYYTTQKLFEMFKHPALGINFDPSHLLWQGMNPALFLRDFSKYVFHVHMKDVAVTLDGRAGILGSHITFGDTRRGWNFRSLGHGNVNFDDIIRELNVMGYNGPLSVEWEDSGMDRMFGATEACEFVKKINFSPSNVAFDDALKS
ncbi:MAG TPA: sugar phosphate isomerase/epimerase [Clostridia bacterium]|nr:sugar phosphate isomerase/epimerase [Clostridia bacterium]